MIEKDDLYFSFFFVGILRW